MNSKSFGFLWVVVLILLFSRESHCQSGSGSNTNGAVMPPLTTTYSANTLYGKIYVTSPTYFVDHSKLDTDFNLDVIHSGNQTFSGFSSQFLNSSTCNLPFLKVNTPFITVIPGPDKEVWISTPETYLDRYRKPTDTKRIVNLDLEKRFIKNIGNIVDGEYMFTLQDTNFNPIDGQGLGNENDGHNYNWCFSLRIWYCPSPSGHSGISSYGVGFESVIYLDGELVNDVIGHNPPLSSVTGDFNSLPKDGTKHKLYIFMCNKGPSPVFNQTSKININIWGDLENCDGGTEQIPDCTNPTIPPSSSGTGSGSGNIPPPLTTTYNSLSVPGSIYTRQPTYFVDHSKGDVDFNMDPSKAGGLAFNGFTSEELTQENCFLPTLNITTPLYNINSNNSDEVWITDHNVYSQRYRTETGKFPIEHSFIKNPFNIAGNEFQFTIDSKDFNVLDHEGYGKENDDHNYNWCFVMKIWYCPAPTGPSGLSTTGTGFETAIFLNNKLVGDSIGHSPSRSPINVDWNYLPKNGTKHKLDIFMCNKGPSGIFNQTNNLHLSIWGDLENCNGGIEVPIPCTKVFITPGPAGVLPLTTTYNSQTLFAKIAPRTPTVFYDHEQTSDGFNMNVSKSGGLTFSGYSGKQLNAENCFLPTLIVSTPFRNINPGFTDEVWISSAQNYFNRFLPSVSGGSGREVYHKLEERFIKNIGNTADGNYMFTLMDTNFNPIDNEGYGNEGDDHNYNWCLVMRIWYCPAPSGHSGFNSLGFGFETVVYLDDELVADSIGHNPVRSNINVDLNYLPKDGTKHKMDIFMCNRGYSGVFNQTSKINLNIFGDLENCDGGDLKIDYCVPPIFTTTATGSGVLPLTTTYNSQAVFGKLFSRTPTVFYDHEQTSDGFNMNVSKSGGLTFSGYSGRQLNAENCFLPTLIVSTPFRNINPGFTDEVWISSAQNYFNRFLPSIVGGSGREVYHNLEERFIKNIGNTADGDYMFTLMDTNFNPIDNEGYGNEGDDHNYNWCLVMRIWYCPAPSGHSGFNSIGFGFETVIYLDDELLADSIGHNPVRSNINVDLNYLPKNGTKHKMDIFMCNRGYSGVFNQTSKINLNIFGDLENCDGGDLKIDYCVPPIFSTTTMEPASTTYTKPELFGGIHTRQPTYILDHKKSETDFNLQIVNEGGLALRGFSALALSPDNCFLPKTNRSLPLMNINPGKQEVWIQSEQSYANRYKKPVGGAGVFEIPIEQRFTRNPMNALGGEYIYTLNSNNFNPIDGRGFGNEGDDHNYNWCMVMRLWYCVPPGNSFMGVSNLANRYESAIYLDGKLVGDQIGHNPERQPGGTTWEFNIPRDKIKHKLDIFMCNKGPSGKFNQTSRINLNIFGDMDSCDGGIEKPYCSDTIYIDKSCICDSNSYCDKNSHMCIPNEETQEGFGCPFYDCAMGYECREISDGETKCVPENRCMDCSDITCNYPHQCKLIPQNDSQCKVTPTCSL
ncbi:hypothetical protein DLAC_09188 [Tieghemostelium lacteum]|uniref:PA14 domain-containing protein n=1 Tax=Tieghemostelium lacteum TaxID=361077 RepID=A0A151Z9D9_TIELA|nr:hypothetical protein DLAC_09188 [Tieghemostelium lacteum]|eukprot:KYQ90562.1 hypothetical protein DLAC_09188 [Tieghemostelium lacteum]